MVIEFAVLLNFEWLAYMYVCVVYELHTSIHTYKYVHTKFMYVLTDSNQKEFFLCFVSHSSCETNGRIQAFNSQDFIFPKPFYLPQTLLLGRNNSFVT